MDVTYPAIITKEEGLFYICFPDVVLNEDDKGQEYILYSTYGESLEHAIEMGKEWLTLALEEYEEEKKEFPKPSSIEEIKKNIKNNQEVVYLTMNYEYEKSLIRVSYVKKTLTIPNHLNILAQNKNINFSQVLQKALKKELGIRD
ncbi:type II toxin-antitoxin system HicB family antitoxin [Fusobacterium necrophorum]|uniref:Antitoxin HicB n=2 Tax=Fusobacterium necrophorum TaxID=859 RepID=A0AAN3VX35_9FUSO|nr:hypothetical protein [Fusobacterium necrophorum]AYV94704.1 antitoxin HicB [Fusobacterium necrophorum subsp. funduliforme]EJU18767.1 hypothetical protein HMPREF1127_1070 [Fusobacterium necrophorum subsp. funduliforme Fnf 1007]KYL02948.1 antitoxin HicB [Fusobacterium necrophorum subsp. funduliforme]KYM37682.1 antitoxin HicB [Fusobacterium necrophorum subsp. funduliforme]KYM52193.1 antitoxin HicB [Fusobacterium necrophorum subsp. funduliforme]